MDTKRHKWAIYITPELSDQYAKAAEEFGLSRGQFALMLMRFGYEAFMRAYRPEKVLSTEDWEKILANVNKKPELPSDQTSD